MSQGTSDNGEVWLNVPSDSTFRKMELPIPCIGRTSPSPSRLLSGTRRVRLLCVTKRITTGQSQSVTGHSHSQDRLSPCSTPSFPNSLPRQNDLIIVGGGAAGTAVLLEMTQRMKQHQQPKSIILIERGKKAGPGLAYSSACEPAILNMHSQTMSLRSDDPNHFQLWLHRRFPESEDTAFPSRTKYGTYLSELLDDTIKEAQALGANVRHIQAEVVDLHQIGKLYEVVLQDQTRLKTYHAVLALGNWTAVTSPHLIGKPGYIQEPWPLSQMESIPKEASVCVIGSRLTAIDVALKLVAQYHSGPITMISRSGRLTKVQGPMKTYNRRWILHTLARDLESNPTAAFSQIMRMFEKEFSQTILGSPSHSSSEHDAAAELRADIMEASAGPIAWQDMLRSTASLAERFWNCFELDEKQAFLRHHCSTWMTYRHAIPLVTATKLLDLLESGQLRVIKGDKVDWNGRNFEVKTCNGMLEQDIVIEAAGQEYDPSKVNSTLLRKLLASGMLHSHPAGGLAVDFSTLAAREGLYTIGSMTLGTHFYTNAVDRNLAHAARVADSVFGLPQHRSLHVAFFIGTDLFSHLIIGRLVPLLIASGHLPFVFQVADKVNTTRNHPLELQELAFFERQLLQEQVLSFNREQGSPRGPCLAVDEMSERHGMCFQLIRDVNSPAFLKFLRDHHIDMGISLRCYQRFRKGIIEHFKNPNTFLNLHPGVLPGYRGVITLLRAMSNREQAFGYSLHNIDENYDSGSVVDLRTRQIDYGKAMLTVMEDIFPLGVDMVFDAVEKTACGKAMTPVKQDARRSRYYTFPCQDELETFKRQGIRLVDPRKTQDLIVKSFAGLDGAANLQQKLEDATNKWLEGHPRTRGYDYGAQLKCDR